MDYLQYKKSSSGEDMQLVHNQILLRKATPHSQIIETIYKVSHCFKEEKFIQIWVNIQDLWKSVMFSDASILDVHFKAF